MCDYEIVKRWKQMGPIRMEYKMIVRFPCGHECEHFQNAVHKSIRCQVCKPKKKSAREYRWLKRGNVVPPSRPSNGHDWDGEKWVLRGLVIEYLGLKLTATQWADVCGISRQRIHQRLARYSTVSEALGFYKDQILKYKDSLDVRGT